MNLLWIIMMAGGIGFSAYHGTIGTLTQTFIDSSSEAINLCVFMLGVVGLWNGMMEIAIRSGFVEGMERWMKPWIHWLFPEIPRNHPVIKYITINMVSNMLGLGWAATPAGLKAMQMLRKLGTKKEQEEGIATNSMCAFLVINISSLQLIPVNMIAYRSQYGSMNPAEIVVPAILATCCSTAAGILFIKWKARKRHRRAL